MPPKSVATESSASANKCRRSKILSDKMKSVVKGQSASLKTKKKGRPLKSSLVKGQFASSNKGQSTSTKNNPRKRRRVMEVDEINDRVSGMGKIEQEDFSTAIKQILKELSPDLEITDEAVADMNIYLNHVCKLLAWAPAVLPLGRSTVSTLRITVMDIETSIPRVIKGELGKYCIAEGRRAIKKWNEVE